VSILRDSNYKPRLLIVGYRKFSELINSIMVEFEQDVNVTIVESVASKSVVYDKLVEQHRPDVIVSAGANASYLESTLSIPVVSQPVTDVDIIEALTKARKISRRIHLFTYQGVKQPTNRLIASLPELLDIELLHHHYSTSDEATEQLLLALAEESAEVIVGPSYTCHMAEQHEVPTILLYSSTSARLLIKTAIQRAHDAIENALRGSLQAVLMDDPHEPLVVCSGTGEILLCNEVASQHWGKNERDLSGFNQRIQLELSGPGETVERLITIDDENWYQRRSPLEIHGDLFGYVFRFIPQRAYRPRREADIAALSGAPEFIIRSSAMETISKLAKTYAITSGAVLIQGESGTGKEHITREIHRHSHYANGPLVAINCGSIPNELFESEMFGYVDGAFTSSRRGGRIGLIQEANQGILFLDEVSELPLLQQSKLLRVLQEKSLRPVGGNREVPLDFKIVAATNANLADCVQAGSFREDLYYRLNVFALHLPPLRERIEDIGAISRYYIERYSQSYHVEVAADELYRLVLPHFEAYFWPGNVRELDNFIERLVVASIDHDAAPFTETRLRVLLPELFSSRSHIRLVTGTLKDKEQVAILDAMKRFNNDKTQVASHLGISSTTLWRRLKAIGWAH